MTRYTSPFSTLASTALVSSPASVEDKAAVRHNLAKMISQAIRHASEVCQREDVKATTRHGRVGVFMTSLRRELNYAFPSYRRSDPDVSRLTDPKSWVDIGVVDTNSLLASYRSYAHSSYFTCADDFRAVVQEANVLAGIPGTHADTFAADQAYLKQLASNLLSSVLVGQSLCTTAAAINADGDKIIAGMNRVCDDLVGADA